jgi:hypothetical protein
VHRSERHSVVVDNWRTSIRAGRDRFRDPGLTVLLILQLCLVFLAPPLAARGLPVARPIIETMVFAVVVIAVMLSHRRRAMPRSCRAWQRRWRASYLDRSCHQLP